MLILRNATFSYFSSETCQDFQLWWRICSYLRTTMDTLLHIGIIIEKTLHMTSPSVLVIWILHYRCFFLGTCAQNGLYYTTKIVSWKCHGLFQQSSLRWSFFQERIFLSYALYARKVKSSLFWNRNSDVLWRFSLSLETSSSFSWCNFRFFVTLRLFFSFWEASSWMFEEMFGGLCSFEVFFSRSGICFLDAPYFRVRNNRVMKFIAAQFQWSIFSICIFHEIELKFSNIYLIRKSTVLCGSTATGEGINV